MTLDTEDLIQALATQTRPIPRRAPELRIAVGIGAGTAVAGAAMALWLGVRPDIGPALGTFPFWMKAFYTLSVAVLAGATVVQLSRPEASLSARHWWLTAPVLVLACLAAFELSRAPSDEWLGLWLGHSARQCPFRIMTLAVPVYLGLVWSFRSLAPSQPAVAGAAAGAAAGGAAATVYALHCPEFSASFVLTWYSLGILASALAGAAGGRVMFRW